MAARSTPAAASASMASPNSRSPARAARRAWRSFARRLANSPARGGKWSAMRSAPRPSFRYRACAMSCSSQAAAIGPTRPRWRRFSLVGTRAPGHHAARRHLAPRVAGARRRRFRRARTPRTAGRLRDRDAASGCVDRARLTEAAQAAGAAMRSASRTRLRSLPAGPSSERPSGAPRRWPSGIESCGKPLRPARHSSWIERLR